MIASSSVTIVLFLFKINFLLVTFLNISQKSHAELPDRKKAAMSASPAASSAPSAQLMAMAAASSSLSLFLLLLLGLTGRLQSSRETWIPIRCLTLAGSRHQAEKEGGREGASSDRPHLYQLSSILEPTVSHRPGNIGKHRQLPALQRRSRSRSRSPRSAFVPSAGGASRAAAAQPQPQPVAAEAQDTPSPAAH